MAKRHSRETAQMMSRSLRESSLHVYESQWARFVSFCRSKRWHVFRVRSHHFSTYMMHLFRDGLLPLTIISHRTSVAYVLCHWVYDPAANPHIKLLIRAFWPERPVQRRIMPKWDLHLVLLALMRPPFTAESDEQDETSDDVIPLKWRTMKTVFLLALASARWRSYIHPLSVAPGRCVFFERKHTAPASGISFAGTWVSRQESATIAGSGVDLRTGYSPSRSVRSGEDALPIQAIKADVYTLLEPQHQRYHEKSYQQMDCGDSQGSLHSSWERECDRVTAHEVRALSASWAYNCQVVLPEILSAAFWRSSGVFQNSYLQDMGCIADGMSTLGPVVVAQDIFSHLHSLHDRYAATATTFLMKITLLLAGIFMHGTE